MIRRFKSFVSSNNLFSNSECILLAVSGGIDSVVMADLFHNTGFKFGIAHCNFSLRGKESDEEEEFTRRLAEHYRVPFFVKKFATADYAVRKKISVQMAARELRYEWFEELRSSEEFDLIATAHHLDDQVETFLINLIRGTGISGLHGILPRQGFVIRPMLFAFRKDISAYAADNHIMFREDSSNREDKYIRNKIRMNIIPMLEEINPEFRKTLTTEISRLRAWEEIGKHEIEKETSGLVHTQNGRTIIDLQTLKNNASVELLAWDILSRFGFNSSVVDDILGNKDLHSGKIFLSPAYRAVTDRKKLIVEPIPAVTHQTSRAITEKRKNISWPVKLRFSILENQADTLTPAGKEYASLDFNKLTFPLEVRKWKPGDSFHPFGMRGKKKVSDLLIDEKVPVPDKENTFVLCSSGKIAWVIGHRIDQRFRITANTTRIFRAVLDFN